MATQPVQNIYEILQNKLNPEQLEQFKKIHYGRTEHCELKLKDSTLEASKKLGIEVSGFSFHGSKEVRKPRLVKVGLIQHSIVLPTSEPISSQRDAIFNKVEKIIELAASEGAQIVCLQEAWHMPFFLCTQEKTRWEEFAESTNEGPSFLFLSELAQRYDMVIISPILEKDDNDIWWNTAVVIDADGSYMGKHRKNHLPSVGSFSETSYYSPGNTGHPVFETKYAKIAINICYGRHHALNWLMFGLNGAEIVFNPAATISEFGESFWGIEARNAAVANGYYTCSINRVGSEEFMTKAQKPVTRSYYGSSYVTAPNGHITPSLSRNLDGLLIAEMDLNLCRQVKDQWGFNMTARLDLYAKELREKLPLQ